MAFGSPLGGSGYWHSLYGSCASYKTASMVEWDMAVSCSPSNVRTDLCSSPGCSASRTADAAGGGWYQQGQDSCTSVSLNVSALPPGPGSPGNHGPQFAEQKAASPDFSSPDWEWRLMWVNGQWYTRFATTDVGVPVWEAPLQSGWHTYSHCQHTDGSNGVIYGVWYDGVRQSFNGPGQTSGIPTLNSGVSSEPLDINAYGDQSGYTFLHGAPMIELNDTNSPPEPPWGWTGTPP